MIDQATFQSVVRQANTAPSIHNAQPARWFLKDGQILIAADLSVHLPQADPEGNGIALSVGAAIEATVLALGKQGRDADVSLNWEDDDRTTIPGHRLAASLHLRPGDPQPLADQLEQRFTWRGRFAQGAPDLFGWTRADTHLVTDATTRSRIAQINDTASLGILRKAPFRKELLSWMRLSPRHPRYLHDGLSAENLRLTKRDAKTVKLGLGPLWGLLDATGRSAMLTAEAPLTETAPVIALFHADKTESRIVTGRAYLRMWLEATKLGFAGWPMAALTDDPAATAAVTTQCPIGPDRNLIQVLRFGLPTGAAPPRMRRPLNEIVP